MKLKGLTKLVLAGTALAATAATLTTSTYAWYVTNAEVKATGVSGQVASSAMGSLFIAKNTIVSSLDKPDNYGPSIILEKAATDTLNDDLAAGKYTLDNLSPQSLIKKDEYYLTADSALDGTATYYTYDESTETYTEVATPDVDDIATYYQKAAKDGEVWVNDVRKEVTGTLLTFKFWLTTDAGGKASPTLMVDNTTSSGTYQTALSTTGLPQAVKMNGGTPDLGANDAVQYVDAAARSQFIVDAVYALRMRVTKTYTEDTYEKINITGTIPSGTYIEDTTDPSGYKEAQTGAAVSSGTNYYKKYTANVGSELATLNVSEFATTKDGKTAYNSTLTKAWKDNNIYFSKDNGDANGYYKDVKKITPYNYNSSNTNKEDHATGVDTLSNIELPAGKDVLLTFEVWLEGSDSGCFDSCRGQTFDFDFKFALAA